MRRRGYALIVGLAAVGTIAAAIAGGVNGPSVRLLFTGDILLTRQVAVERERTHGSPWDSISSMLKQADWAGGNLEGAIGPDSACVPANRELCFAFDNDTPALLASAGFDAVTVENNHAGDIGSAARALTIRALATAGINGIDFDRSPRFVRVRDVTIGIVAISLIPDADGRVQGIPSVEVAQRLRLAHALSNIVIVSIHWGNELQDWPNATQREVAKWLVDQGADVIVGHHPHVVQKPDCVHGHPVFFSLGNHVFDQKYPETKEGLIADCRVRGAKLRCGGIRTHARRGSAMPVVSGPLGDRALDACPVTVRPSMVVSNVMLRPVGWSRSNGDSVGAIEGSQKGTKRVTPGGVATEGSQKGTKWVTPRVELVSIDTRLRSLDHEELLFALERHPSTFDGENAPRPHVYAVTDRGLVARWRGTSLAWPLVDAFVDSAGDLCALHRGDSFVRLDSSNAARRTMRYRWNGFGFSATQDDRGECARSYAAIRSLPVTNAPSSAFFSPR